MHKPKFHYFLYSFKRTIVQLFYSKKFITKRINCEAIVNENENHYNHSYIKFVYCLLQWMCTLLPLIPFCKCTCHLDYLKYVTHNRTLSWNLSKFSAFTFPSIPVSTSLLNIMLWTHKMFANKSLFATQFRLSCKWEKFRTQNTYECNEIWYLIYIRKIIYIRYTLLLYSLISSYPKIQSLKTPAPTELHCLHTTSRNFKIIILSCKDLNRKTLITSLKYNGFQWKCFNLWMI